MRRPQTITKPSTGKEEVLKPWEREKKVPSEFELLNSFFKLGGGLLINDRHRFIFLKVAKNGGSTVRERLACAFCGKKSIKRKEECIAAVKPTPDNVVALREKIQEYTVFAVSRNPRNRARSMYRYSQCFDRIDFPTFIQEPTRCYKIPKNNTHVSSLQTQVFYSPKGIPIFDHMVPIEEFDQQFPAIFNTISSHNNKNANNTLPQYCTTWTVNVTPTRKKVASCDQLFSNITLGYFAGDADFLPYNSSCS